MSSFKEGKISRKNSEVNENSLKKMAKRCIRLGCNDKHDLVSTLILFTTSPLLATTSPVFHPERRPICKASHHFGYEIVWTMAFLAIDLLGQGLGNHFRHNFHPHSIKGHLFFLFLCGPLNVRSQNFKTSISIISIQFLGNKFN